MTPQQVVGLGVRLFAIWLAIMSIRYFSSVPAAIAAQPVISGKFIQSYIVGGIYLITAIALWIFPMAVAHKIIPRTSFNDKLPVETFGAARVGCSLIGLWFFAKSLQSIVWILFLSILTSGTGSAFNMTSTVNKVDLVVSVFEAILGIVLMTRSSLFARFVIR